MPERDQIILEILAKALTLLDALDKASNTGDKSSNQLLLWKSAAEAEYCAFQISTLHGLMDYDAEDSSSGDDPQVPIGLARALLREAEAAIQADPRRAYRAVRNAVTVLRRAYAAVEKLPRSETRGTTQQ